MNTGLPTVLGWPHHVKQRGLPELEVVRRRNEIREIYQSPDVQKTLELIEKYAVQYIVIGKLERRQYARGGLKKFDLLPNNFPLLFQAGQTKLYATPITGTSRAVPKNIDTEEIKSLVRIKLPYDLAELLREGDLKVTYSDPSIDSSSLQLFDGDTSSLVRSEQVNPLVITLRFKQPITIKSVDIFPSYSSYDWKLYATPESKAVSIKYTPEEKWSQVDLPTAVQTSVVRLEVLRLLRDDYVHLNEIELYPE
jgi:hypothetical protein